ncbi:MAG TPA: 7-cyano-7-deazaguanine synthase [Vicinamibacterales bacterium]|nr:7-cyano-7-deazaguanine synthase [Vicinamibacterales bacterium]
MLFSGGLDSAVLLALELRAYERVLPIHVRTGLAWEAAEARAIACLLAQAPFAGRVEPGASLAVDMRDVYPATHWAVEGRPPAYDTPDEDVYLEGRNLILISKAAVLCARRAIGRIALGPLAGNPFPDATPQFLAAIAHAASLGLDHAIEVAAPLVDRRKADVVRLGLELGVPLELTLSCMNPQGDRHCGRCSKCRERIDAFTEVGLEDPVEYASSWTPRGGSQDNT